MITTVQIKDLKGVTAEVSIPQRLLIAGPNGAGKTAITQGLLLAAQGYVPGVGKRPGDIIQALAPETANEIRARITTSSGVYERRYSRTKTGGSGELRLNHQKVKQAEFDAALAREGIGIADMAEFLGMSDQARIAHLFKLFPPRDGDAMRLGQDLAETNDHLKRVKAALKEQEQALAGFQNDLQSMTLPNATLPQIKQEQAAVETEIARLREQREQALAIEAARAERERLEQEQREQAALQPETTAGQTGADFPTEPAGPEFPIDFGDEGPTYPGAPAFPEPDPRRDATLSAMRELWATIDDLSRLQRTIGNTLVEIIDRQRQIANAIRLREVSNA